MVDIEVIEELVDMPKFRNARGVKWKELGRYLNEDHNRIRLAYKQYYRVKKTKEVPLYIIDAFNKSEEEINRRLSENSHYTQQEKMLDEL